MQPDLHMFIEGKISWVILPEGSKTCKGPFDYREWWPKSSLRRLDAAVQRAQERKKLHAEAAQAESREVEEEKEADKTPTAQTPEEKDDVAEDDEEFERRYLKTEKALQERLEQLSLKLTENEKVQGDDLRPDIVQAAKEPPTATSEQGSVAKETPTAESAQVSAMEEIATAAPEQGSAATVTAS
jgi:dGTP triphosphohydrolase